MPLANEAAAELARVADRAVDHGVAFVPGAHFFAEEGRPNTLRLSFTALSPGQLDEALERLGAAVRQHRPAQVSRR